MINNSTYPIQFPGSTLFHSPNPVPRLIAAVMLVFSFAFASIGQESNFIFRVIDTKKAAIPYATVRIATSADSSHAKEKVTDSTGTVSFSLASGNDYLVTVSSVNYATLRRAIKSPEKAEPVTLTLQPAAKNIGNVIVTSSRPVMRQEDDKTIVDPQNLAESSTNAYEIMEKTPGLFVDQDGNIYLNSTTPAIVYINGREQKMSTADIASMLRSLPPNAIASIEILRTPSARYDASGGGGIVNVVLRKGVRIGLTGSATAGMNQGKYGNQFAGINLNNNNGSVSSFLNFQYTRRNSYDEVKTNRIFAPDSLLSQDAYSTYPTNSYFLGFGVGYQVSKRLELNYDSRLALSTFTNTTDNINLISQISSGKTATNTNSNVVNNGNSFNLSQGLSSKYKIGNNGSEWTTDLSYNYSPNTNDQAYANIYNTPLLPATGGDGHIQTRLHFFSAQTNLLLKLPKQFTLETGIKSTNVIFRNVTEYYKATPTVRTKDIGRTSSYNYNESINAGYIQVSKNIFGITAKAGTRIENTIMDGDQLVPKDTSFSLHRTDLFPYVYISKNLMKIMSYQLRAYLVYRRTISRPGYQLLSPSQRYIDQYLYETGNPSLRPQFTKNYEANISVDERPIFAIGYNDTKDIFSQVVYQSDASHSVAYRTYDNLGSNKEMYFRILGALPPGKKVFVVAGAQYNHNLYSGLYENKPLSYKRGSWSFFTYQTLKVTPTTQLTLNGFVRFNGQLQFYNLSTFGALNLSINKQLMNKKMMVSLSVTDLLASNRYDFTLQQGSVNASGFRKGDTRRVGLNIRYNFGLRKKEENNMFNLESPEKATN